MFDDPAAQPFALAIRSDRDIVDPSPPAVASRDCGRDETAVPLEDEDPAGARRADVGEIPIRMLGITVETGGMPQCLERLGVAVGVVANAWIAGCTGPPSALSGDLAAAGADGAPDSAGPR